jgi:hypothetical protein
VNANVLVRFSVDMRQRLDATAKMVFASSLPTLSAKCSGSISVAHTSANGSGRVSHVRGTFVSEGSGPRCHVRAVLSLIPAADAAASNVLFSIRFFLSKRTCLSCACGCASTGVASRCSRGRVRPWLPEDRRVFGRGRHALVATNSPPSRGVGSLAGHVRLARAWERLPRQGGAFLARAVLAARPRSTRAALRRSAASAPRREPRRARARA